MSALMAGELCLMLYDEWRQRRAPSTAASAVKPSSNLTTASTVADSTGCINGLKYQTTNREAVFDPLPHYWPARSSANSSIVNDLVVSENIARIRDCLDFCAQYNSNLTAISSNCSAVFGSRVEYVCI